MTLGLDISTSVIGYSLFGEDGSLKEMNYIKFKNKLTLYEKLDEFKKKTNHLSSLPLKRVAIEEPLKKMKGKFSNANTISILNFFNGMISAHIYETYGIEPVHYNVNSARSTVFPDIKSEGAGTIKQLIWEAVMKMEPKINWHYNRKGVLSSENFDMADSYVVAMCDIIFNLELEKKKEEKTK